KESKTYENLGKRLDDEYGKVTAQLAETETQINRLDINKASKSEVNELASDKADKKDVRYRNEPISEDDLTTSLKESITGNADLNLLSIPQDGSVDAIKTNFIFTGK